MSTRPLSRAQAALWEAYHTGLVRGWHRYWLALVADRTMYPGGPLRVATMRESMPLTCGLLGRLTEVDLLLVGRHEARVRDGTPWNLTADYDETSPVTEVSVEVLLPAEPSSMLAVASASIRLTTNHDTPAHVILGALERPKGWPL